jgi:hypothetical protein
MFVDQLGRKNIANPVLYFDCVLDCKGRLVHVLWADGTCRKNYALESFSLFTLLIGATDDVIYLRPITGVNHHRASVCFGA